MRPPTIAYPMKNKTTTKHVLLTDRNNTRRKNFYRCCAIVCASLFPLFCLFNYHPDVHRSSVITYECLRYVGNYETCGCGDNPLPCPCWETIGWETPPCIRHRLERLLAVVVKTFEELEVEYKAVEGTLLGALRHGDFLPWEDDVDFNVRLGEKEGWLGKAEQICGKVSEEGFGCFVHPRDDINAAKEWMFSKDEGRRTIVIYDTEYMFGLRQGVRADITLFESFGAFPETIPCLLGKTVLRCPKNFYHSFGRDSCLLYPVNTECQKIFGKSRCERPDLVPSIEKAIKELDSAGYPSLIELLPKAKETNYQSC
ncbi:LicD family protein [Balamuthia mandrillaris]